MMSNEFGKLLQDSRERAALTQGELADMISVSQQAIAKWESGKASPRPPVLTPLAKALNISAGLLIEARQAQRQSEDREIVSEAQRQLMPPESAPDWVNKVAALDSPDQDFPAYSLHKRPSAYSEEFMNAMLPLLNDPSKEASWDVRIRGASVAWRIDYFTDNVAVCFKHSDGAGSLRAKLSMSERSLWSLATLRAYLNDKRRYILILTLPDGVSLEDKTDHSPIPTETMFRRRTAEAELLGISVFLARTPRQVVSIIQSGDPASDIDWAEEYDRND